jgi:hypothetical protein
MQRLLKAGQAAARVPISARCVSTAPVAQVAQLVEHVTENHGVGGSIPPLGTNQFLFHQFFHMFTASTEVRSHTWSHTLACASRFTSLDEDGGPLQVLRRRLPDHNRMVRGKFPILSQERLETALGDFDPDRDVVTCTGKAGTVIFADTAALYHRGKPASTRDRCAIFFNYMNRSPLRPFRCERSPISGRRPGPWPRPCRSVSATACFGATPSPRCADSPARAAVDVGSAVDSSPA